MTKNRPHTHNFSCVCVDEKNKCIHIRLKSKIRKINKINKLY